MKSTLAIVLVIVILSLCTPTALCGFQIGGITLDPPVLALNNSYSVKFDMVLTLYSSSPIVSGSVNFVGSTAALEFTLENQISEYFNSSLNSYVSEFLFCIPFVSFRSLYYYNTAINKIQVDTITVLMDDQSTATVPSSFTDIYTDVNITIPTVTSIEAVVSGNTVLITAVVSDKCTIFNLEASNSLYAGLSSSDGINWFGSFQVSNFAKQPNVSVSINALKLFTPYKDNILIPGGDIVAQFPNLNPIIVQFPNIAQTSQINITSIANMSAPSINSPTKYHVIHALFDIKSVNRIVNVMLMSGPQLCWYEILSNDTYSGYCVIPPYYPQSQILMSVMAVDNTGASAIQKLYSVNYTNTFTDKPVIKNITYEIPASSVPSPFGFFPLRVNLSYECPNSYMVSQFFGACQLSQVAITGNSTVGTAELICYMSASSSGISYPFTVQNTYGIYSDSVSKPYTITPSPPQTSSVTLNWLPAQANKDKTGIPLELYANFGAAVDQSFYVQLDTDYNAANFEANPVPSGVKLIDGNRILFTGTIPDPPVKSLGYYVVKSTATSPRLHTSRCVELISGNVLTAPNFSIQSITLSNDTVAVGDILVLKLVVDTSNIQSGDANISYITVSFGGQLFNVPSTDPTQQIYYAYLLISQQQYPSLNYGFSFFMTDGSRFEFPTIKLANLSLPYKVNVVNKENEINYNQLRITSLKYSYVHEGLKIAFSFTSNYPISNLVVLITSVYNTNKFQLLSNPFFTPLNNVDNFEVIFTRKQLSNIQYTTALLVSFFDFSQNNFQMGRVSTSNPIIPFDPASHDYASPIIHSITVSNNVDSQGYIQTSTNGGAIVTFDIHVTDDKSGVDGIYVQANYYLGAVLNQSNLISGNQNDGVYRFSLVLPQYTVGNYSFLVSKVIDKFGNTFEPGYQYTKFFCNPSVYAISSGDGGHYNTPTLIDVQLSNNATVVMYSTIMVNVTVSPNSVSRVEFGYQGAYFDINQINDTYWASEILYLTQYSLTYTIRLTGLDGTVVIYDAKDIIEKLPMGTPIAVEVLNTPPNSLFISNYSSRWDNLQYSISFVLKSNMISSYFYEGVPLVCMIQETVNGGPDDGSVRLHSASFAIERGVYASELAVTFTFKDFLPSPRRNVTVDFDWGGISFSGTPSPLFNTFMLNTIFGIETATTAEIGQDPVVDPNSSSNLSVSTLPILLSILACLLFNINNNLLHL